MTRDDGQSSTRQIGPIAVLLSLVYGVLAAYIFCFSGSFGRLGEYWWFDVALITITITASLSLAYVSLLIISYVRQKAVESGDPTDFTWHFLIPCRDEESVIAETVSAARTSFPDAHIWVIDDASEDATAAIVTDIMDVDDRTHLISRVLPEARTGKGKALNAAYRSVSEFVGADLAERARAVIGVLDADGFLSDNALAVLSGPAGFGDDTLGAAQLEVWMKNRGDKRPRPGRNWFLNLLGRFLIRMQDIEFRTSNSAMQQLRVTTGTVGMGGNGQFTRLTVLDALTEDHGEPWGNKLSEDYELGLNILTRGFRNGYFPQAHVSQEALPYFRRLLTQRTRWGQGIMECASNLPALRRSRVLRFPGFVEIHYFMSQPWLMMLNLLLIPIVTAVAVVQGFFGFVTDAATWIIVLTGLVFVVLPYALWGPLYRRWGPEPIGRATSVLLGLGYLVYVYFTYFYYPRAIARMVTGRNSWAKTKRNADDVLVTSTFTPAALQVVPLLDQNSLTELAEELEGRDEYAEEIVSRFALIWPRRLANLQRAVAAEDVLATSDAIASIRVSSTMVGARRLQVASEDFTTLVEAREFDAARAALPRLARVGDDTLVEIRSRFLDLPTRGQH
ncbi:glycosyltransferase [Brevibacterium sp. JSBI002]|uniref:glycosyltransferase n=1 Tax=Brevibacterium sp. JSBI002 TaxID=2886045 RepID=UPI00222E8033|nr:glycosyltransferase [Brevibacterium sp. JSBI002]UZD62561.1 glycosyltransferase [Brevibacterium sp. JSBI002]